MELLRKPNVLASNNVGAFEKHLETFQLTPGTVPPQFERFESGDSVLVVQRFTQGVELRALVPAGRVVGASILESRAPVHLNGVPWRQNETVAFTDDRSTRARKRVLLAWLETGRASLGLAPHASSDEADALVFEEPGAPLALHPDRRDPVERAVSNVARGLRWAQALRPARAARYEFARSVERLMWENVDALLSLKTISALTARSPRSVHHAFTSSFGFGPLSYFKILRLNAVRKSLADPAREAAIIDIAAEYGFWHLGHFGTSYKQFFGETPSQTRRRAAGEAIAF